MALAPSNITFNLTDDINLRPSKTHFIDFRNNRIIGMVDGIDALRQTIMKELLTTRYLYVIHTDRYGIEDEQLFGGNMTRELLENEIQNSFTDAIIFDDRVLGVENYAFTNRTDSEGRIISDNLMVSFDVRSIFGTLPMQVVVGGGQIGI